MLIPPAEAVLDSLSTEVVLLDPQGRILCCNRAWRRFGENNGIEGPRRDWKGLDYLEASRGPDGGDAARVGILEVLQGKRPRFDLEYPCHDESHQRWFEMTATRLDGPGGPWVVVAHVNITDRHEVEALRRQRWEDAQAIKAGAERARFMRGFLNEVAHEVSTPLTALVLRLKALATTLGPEESAALSAPIERLQRAVRGIATIGDALGSAPTVAVVPLDSLSQVMAGLAPEARRRQLRLQSDLPTGALRTDAGLLHGCLTALAMSAAAACPSGGSLSLRTQVAGPYAHVRLEADAGARLMGSDADLWLLSARELARRAGLGLQEEDRSGQRSYSLKVPLAAALMGPGSAAGSASSAA